MVYIGYDTYVGIFKKTQFTFIHNMYTYIPIYIERERDNLKVATSKIKQ